LPRAVSIPALRFSKVRCSTIFLGLPGRFIFTPLSFSIVFHDFSYEYHSDVAKLAPGVVESAPEVVQAVAEAEDSGSISFDIPEGEKEIEFEVVDFPRKSGEKARTVEETAAQLDKILDERRWDDAIFFYMDVLLRVLPVNADIIEKIMGVTETIGRPSETILVFFEPRTSYVKRTPRMYGKLMRAHQLRGNIEKMHGVFREMVDKGIPRSIECYNALLYENQAENNIDATYETEAMINRESITFDSVTYDRLLAIYYNNGKTEDVDRLLDQIVATNARVGALGLSLLAQRALAKDDFAGAKQLSVQIAKQREVPHRVFFDALIEYYIRQGQVPRAVRTLRDMKNYNLVPSSDSMRYLVKYHADREQSERAIQFVNELKAAKQQPDLDIYTTVTDMLYRSKSVHDFRTYITEMMDAKILPLRRTWKLYIELATNYLQDLEEIENVFDWVKQVGNKLDHDEYKLLLRAYCRLGRPDMALHLRDHEMSSEKLVWDASDYTAVVQSVAQFLSAEQALLLINEMRQKKLQLDISVYVTNISCRTRLLQHDEARASWNELSSQFPTLRLTGSIAVQLMQNFASLGDAESIEAIFTAVKTHFPKSMNVQLYEAYFSQAAFSKSMEVVMKAYNEMRNPTNPDIRPVEPSNTMFLFLMKQAYRNGASGLNVAASLLSDALVSKNSSPLYTRVATVFLLHLLQFGNIDVFEPAADLLKRINGLGFAYLNQELANALTASLSSTFLPKNIAPKARQLPRDLAMLHNFTALRQGQL
jgi:pentatricopeptide repeat protein